MLDFSSFNVLWQNPLYFLHSISNPDEQTLLNKHLYSKITALVFVKHVDYKKKTTTTKNKACIFPFY